MVNNEITFTKEKLEELTDKFYQAGLEDGRSIITTPIYPSYPTWRSNEVSFKAE
jgi:hypothetical protein